MSVTSHYDLIKYLLLKFILHCRVRKFTLALIDFSLTYVPFVSASVHLVEKENAREKRKIE